MTVQTMTPPNRFQAFHPIMDPKKGLRMFKLLFMFLFLYGTCDASHINLTQSDNLFVRVPIPKKGIVCSNQGRADRISQVLHNRQIYEVPWGPKIYIGDYKGEKIFIASAPVGSGLGLMFTELYSAGAEYIVRYGSDDVKSPPKRRAFNGENNK